MVAGLAGPMPIQNCALQLGKRCMSRFRMNFYRIDETFVYIHFSGNGSRVQ
jgi:hypothetical protein